MTLTIERTEKHHRTRYAKVIKRIEGYYAPEEVPFGVVYRWQPGYVLIECGCDKTLTLTCSMATCSECGTDHAAVVREELAGQCSEDEALHPWRYARGQKMSGCLIRPEEKGEL